MLQEKNRRLVGLYNIHTSIYFKLHPYNVFDSMNLHRKINYY